MFFMASKGQKFNKYTDESKKDIALQHINEGKSYGYLSNTYGIPQGTIMTWVRTFNLGNENMSDNRGRPKKDKEQDYKEKYEILKNYQAFLKAQREKK